MWDSKYAQILRGQKGLLTFEDIYQNAFEPTKILYWHIHTFPERFVIYINASFRQLEAVVI